MSGKVAAITMVRSDLFLLKKWLEYYGRNFGRENLYVICHGGDASIVEACAGSNVIRVPVRGSGDTVGKFEFNRHRADLVEGLVTGLLKYYDRAIYTDVDEFIVLDPSVGTDLSAYILSCPAEVCSPFGLDLTHVSDKEPEALSPSRNILEIRRFCKVADRYTKPVIVASPVSWHGGFHSSNKRRLFIPDGLYLFHLKWVDRSLSTNTHYARSLNKVGADVEVDLSLEERSENFNLKSKVNDEFQRFNEMPVSAEFEFGRQIRFFRRTWRPHAFVMNPRFWKWLVRQNAEKYVFYWKFGRLKEDVLYEIPPRFSRLF